MSVVCGSGKRWLLYRRSILAWRWSGLSHSLVVFISTFQDALLLYIMPLFKGTFFSLQSVSCLISPLRRFIRIAHVDRSVRHGFSCSAAEVKSKFP